MLGLLNWNTHFTEFQIMKQGMGPEGNKLDFTFYRS